jgi:hypothetical protein
MPNYPYPPQAGWESYEDGPATASASGSGNGGGWYVPPEGYSGYPPGPSSSYQGQTPRRDTVGSTGRLSFSTQPDASEKTPGSGSGAGAGGKKKRKKGSPGETEKEKEKRTKTGRACDACVRLSALLSLSIF